MSNLNEDKRPYSESRAVLGNTGIFLWLALGTIAIWFLNPLGAGLFAFVAFVAVYAVVRKQLCKTCAYCKKCTQGFGKLPELIFGKAELGGVKPRTLRSLLIFTYILLTAIPGTLLVFSISQEFAAAKILDLTSLIAFFAFSVATKRKGEFMKN